MIRKIVSAIYILSTLTMLLCTSLSAILLIVKMCGASGASWLACCMPLIITIGLFPIFMISKFILDQKGGK